MTSAIIEFILSAAAVIVAGSFLARAADKIAELTGLGRLLIGCILLAGATSLPELCVDVSAALKGLDDLAVGDLMGSCLANLIILAIADMLTASRGGLFSRTAARHALSGTMAITMTAIAALMMVSRIGWEFAGVGIGSVVVFVVYVLGVRIIYYDQQVGDAERAKLAEHQPAPGSLRNAILQFSLAAVGIFVASPFVASSAGKIAEISGLGNTFVGTTLVALSTSLPELVATIASVRMGAFDLAVANIFGSNVFNMAMLLPVDIASKGPLLSKVSPTHLITCMWVIVITSVAIVGQLYHVERRRRFIEPDAIMIFGMVIAALVMVYYLG